MNSIRSAMALFLSLLLPLSIFAATSNEIALAIQNLGASDHKKREAATLFLWKAGQSSIAVLDQAAHSDDIEVRLRAKQLLKDIQSGIMPDTPPATRDLVQKFTNSSDPEIRREILRSLFRLDRRGQNIAILLLLRIEDNRLREEFVREMSPELSTQIPKLISQGEYETVESFLTLLSMDEQNTFSQSPRDTDTNLYYYLSPIRNLAAFQLWRGKLQESIDRFENNSAGQTNAFIAGTLAILYRAQNNPAKAMSMARQSRDVNLLTGFLAEAGEWDEIIAMTTVKESAISTLSTNFPCMAAYERLAGHEDRANYYLDLYWKSLQTGAHLPGPIFSEDAFVANGQPEREHSDYSASYRYFSRQFSELIGEHHENRELQEGQVDEICISAQILFQINETNRCTALLKAAVQNCATGEWENRKLTEAALKTRNFTLVEPWFQHGVPNWIEFDDLKTLMWSSLTRKYPNDTAASLLARYQDLVNCRLEKLESKEIILGALEDLMARKSPQQSAPFLSLAKFAEKLGDIDLALLCTTSTANPVPAYLGRLLISQKRWREALSALKDDYSAESLMLQGYATRQLGNTEEGDRLIRLAEIIPLANDCGGRESTLRLADELELPESKKRQLELIRRTGAFFQDCDCPEPLALAETSAANGEYFEAASVRERTFFSLLRGRSINGRYWRDWFDDRRDICDPSWIHEWRACGFLQKKNIKEAMHEVDLCLRYLPGRIDMPSKVVPELDRLGQKTEADLLFDRVYTFLSKLTTDFPLFPQGHHDLARLTHICHRRMEDGLIHAQKAVELDPDNKIYRDTLAAVQNVLNSK